MVIPGLRFEGPFENSSKTLRLGSEILSAIRLNVHASILLPGVSFTLATGGLEGVKDFHRFPPPRFILPRLSATVSLEKNYVPGNIYLSSEDRRPGKMGESPKELEKFPPYSRRFEKYLTSPRSKLCNISR